ncbi:MAG: dual specificity protein phosphatase family protein [Planctomycetales bacterium]|nr:dual specificity protein phosphatase family protein [Planctomycetales bacterium]
MIQIKETRLWLGNASDLRDMAAVLDQGITAIIDLAAEEPVPVVFRALNYCRFVLSDDGGNDESLVEAAIVCSAALLRTQQTAICCAAGLSRSAAISAAALALSSGRSLDEALARIAQYKHLDVNPALWKHIAHVYSRLAPPPTVS